MLLPDPRMLCCLSLGRALLLNFFLMVLQSCLFDWFCSHYLVGTSATYEEHTTGSQQRIGGLCSLMFYCSGNTNVFLFNLITFGLYLVFPGPDLLHVGLPVMFNLMFLVYVVCLSHLFLCCLRSAHYLAICCTPLLGCMYVRLMLMAGVGWVFPSSETSAL